MRFLAVVLLLASTVSAADTIKISPLTQTLPDIRVDLYKIATFKFNFEKKPGWEDGDKIISFDSMWEIPTLLDYIQSLDGTFYCTAPVGIYQISGKENFINWTKQDVDQRKYEITIIVGGTGPTPPVPVPGNPLLGGFKVLIIEEQSQRRSLTPEQQGIFNSIVLWEYLHEKTIKDSNGEPEWRILDKDTVFNTDNQWKKAMAVPRTASFWVIVSNGTNWESVPLPKNVADMMILMKKYGERIRPIQRR